MEHQSNEAEKETPSVETPAEGHTAVHRGPSKTKRAPLALAIGILAVGTVVALFAAGIITPEKIGMKSQAVAAVVNGEKITVAYVDERLAQVRPTLESQGFNFSDESAVASLRTQAIDDLVNETILIQQAKDAGIEVTDEDVDSEYQGIIDSLGGQEAFETALASVGLTEDRLRSDLRRQLYVERYVERYAANNSIEVTDKEISDLYTNLKTQNSEMPPLEEVRESLRAEIRQQKIGQLIGPHIQELRASAQVEIM